MYYGHIRDEKLLDITEAKYLDEDILNIEISKELYDLYTEDDLQVVYKNGEIIKNPNYEQDKKERENKERIEEIKQELEELDLKTIRPLRAGETERLEELETKALELREELQKLMEE